MFIRHQGERASQKIGNQEDAEAVAQAVRAEIARGKFDLASIKARAAEIDKSVTLADYYQRFAKVYLETGVRESTRKSYETSFRVHVLPAFGSLPLDAITKPKVKDFIAELVAKDFG